VTLTGGFQNVNLEGEQAAAAWFSQEWPAGMRIRIAGSGCNGNDYCTIASVTSQTVLTIVETSATVVNVRYTSAGFGFLIGKATATGTASISVVGRLSAYQQYQQAQAQMCSPQPKTTTVSRTGAPLGYTLTGYLCLVSRQRDAETRLYWISAEEGRDPEFRLLSLIAAPSAIPGYNVNDNPTGPGFSGGPSAGASSFDQVDPNIFYLVRTTTVPGCTLDCPPALWKITYPAGLGYVEPTNIRNSYARNGFISGYTDPLVWENVTKFSEGRSLSQQILANTTYNTAYWPALTGIKFSGATNGYAQFFICLTGQDLPCAVFYFTASSGNFANWFDGMANSPAGAGFMGNHNTTPVAGIAQITNWSLNQGATRAGIVSTAGNAVTASSGFITVDQVGSPIVINGVYYTIASFVDFTNWTVTPSAGVQTNVPFASAYQPGGGPFSSTPTCVYKGGTCNANTSISGIIGDASYDSACPVDLPAKFVALGATGNQCVTLRVSGEPCSLYPTGAERSTYPCPNAGSGLASWMGRPIAPEDIIYDNIDPERLQYGEREYLMLVRKTDVGGGIFELVFLRDASTGYSCQMTNQLAIPPSPGSRGRLCAATAALATHLNGWSGRWTPSGQYPIYNPATQTFTPENQFLTRAHSDRGLTASGIPSYVGFSGYFNVYFSRTGGVIGGPADAYYAGYPVFTGISSAADCANGCVQSYISTAAENTTGLNTILGTDWRHLNSAGNAPEVQNSDLGALHTTLALQPGTTSVYKILPISGTYDPKKRDLIAWAGLYLGKEKSGPQNTGNYITDADTWRFCYAYRANECRAGSTAGDVFFVVPGLDVSKTTCVASQLSNRIACVFAATPIAAKGMQVLFTSDPDNIHQRGVGMLLTRPGAQYSYSHLRMFPNGRCMLGTYYHLGGTWSGPTLMCAGQMINDSRNRSQWQPVEVKSTFSSGFVQFGYDSNFYCAPRAEVCQVAAAAINQAVPYTYAHEAITPVSGSTRITIPALPGRILYYRTVNAGINGPTQTIAVP
jgi:hypothetical protein